MVKQVKVPIQPIITNIEGQNLPLVEVVENVNPSQPQQTTNSTSITNIGIQANNIYISGFNSTVQQPVNTSFNSNPLQTSYVTYGSQEYINIGAYPNDGTGDPLRVAFEKINNNFSNLFSTTFNTVESITEGLTPNQVILSQPADTFMQGTFQIKSFNPLNNDMQNVVLSAALNNDATAVKFTGYATLFNGNTLCRYDMDISSENVRILINPLANVLINHYITYQVTDSGFVTSPSLGLDGYPAGTIMETEDDLFIVTEGP